MTLMTDRTDDAPDPQRHPELLMWLSERSSGFENWAQATGTPERWDFSPASLDVLEDLLRQTLTGEEDIDEQRRGAFIQGAVWYLGEVACRATGVVWKYEPFAFAGEPLPSLFAEVYASGTIGLDPDVRPGSGRRARHAVPDPTALPGRRLRVPAESLDPSVLERRRDVQP
ncbi:hypothetical protein [Kitasatospora atroaurantiaca]|uniref:hypothetical protein n=2 Tax=Kitasatospora atroaurantiaca TaxID=285545 RepID=UPI0014785F29